MSKTDPKANEPIKFETIYPIHIRKKDAGLSFTAPGETVAFETDTDVKIAMLAHRLNELVTQMHRMQRVVFANNQMIANMLKDQNGKESKATSK